MRHLLAAALLISTSTACSAQPKEAEPEAPAEAVQATETPDAHAAQPTTCSADNSAETWLEKIEQRATDIQTLNANLRYDNNQLLLGDEQRRFGKLVYDAGPPPRFAIHFDRKMVDGHWTEPDLYYIYDGRWLLKRDHESKSAVRYQLVPDDEEVGGEMELGEGPFPIPLNLKKDKVLARFEVELVEPTEDDPENSVHLKLTPREDHETDLTQIDLWFDRESLLPVKVSSLDDSETQTVVLLTKTQVNEALPDQAFDTALPTEPGWQTDENLIAPKEAAPADADAKPIE